MPDETKKNIGKRRKEPAAGVRAASRPKPKTDWEHRTTDPADVDGTQTIPDRSGDYEVTTDFRQIPRR